MAATVPTPDVKFSPKRPGDVERFAINFLKLVPAGVEITNPTITVEALGGKTPASTMVRDGTEEINGPIVSVLVGDGDSGSIYGLRFAVNAGEQRYEILGSLPVQE
jgi:hypothetical protein